jgi:hypothetical protein
MATAFEGISRVRILALLVVGANLLGTFTVRMLSGSLRATGAELYGEMLVFTIALVGAGCLAGLVLSGVLASCFYTYQQRRSHDPLVGEEFMPAWADIALIASLLGTAVLLIRAGFF